MATIGYVQLSSNRDTVCEQILDIGKSDRWFLEKASDRSVSVLKRPKFLEARKALGKGDTFVVGAVGLLSTNPRELLQALQSLRRKGVTVVFARAPFTLASTHGKAYMAMLRTVVKMQVRLQRLQW
jgi:DNA invertase Pin-like site-specific DNA recombinase